MASYGCIFTVLPKHIFLCKARLLKEGQAELRKGKPQKWRLWFFSRSYSLSTCFYLLNTPYDGAEKAAPSLASPLHPPLQLSITGLEILLSEGAGTVLTMVLNSDFYCVQTPGSFSRFGKYFVAAPNIS